MPAEFEVTADEVWLDVFGVAPTYRDDFVREVRPLTIPSAEVVISWDPVARSARLIYDAGSNGPLVEVYKECVTRLALHHGSGFVEVEVHSGLDGGIGVTKLRLEPRIRLIDLFVRG